MFSSLLPGAGVVEVMRHGSLILAMEWELYNGNGMSWWRDAWDNQGCRKYLLLLPACSGLLAQRKAPAQRELPKHLSTQERHITNKPNHRSLRSSYDINGGTSNVHIGG